MSTKLSPYTHPPPLRSALIKNVTDAIPQIDELEQLQYELKLLKQKTLERVKKAGEDLKTIEESMRRMKEKEKGKARAIDKVKRERDYTPIPDSDESRSTSAPYSVSSKLRSTPHPTVPLPSSSSRPTVDPRRLTVEDIKKKKKKRKREDEESDAESEFARPRKSTPPTVSHPPQKAGKSTPLSSQPRRDLQPSAGPDFTVPHASSYQSLYVTRPSISVPPIPGPSKPTDVMDDFSKLKMPQQIQVSSFYASIEPWLRPIREEDVGFLEYTGDEVEPFIMPKLGRHYLEAWEADDPGLVQPVTGFTHDAPAEQFSAPTPKWDPSTLMEPELLVEEKGHGPLTERVISALLPVPDVAVWKGVKAAEDAMEGRPGGSGAAAARKERLNVSELENRIKDTMRYHGLLGGMPDFTEKVDDPIATALRHAQRELRIVLGTNKARRVRLGAIARDHLAYQEYLELRDSIDKNVSALFGKLQKKDGPKIGKKKKKIVANGATTGGAEAHLPLPAALGLGPDDENRLVVNDQLNHLVETRRQWVNTVGKFFDDKQRDNPGRVWGLPAESLFRDMQDEIQRNLEGIEKGVSVEEERRRRAKAIAEAAATSAAVMEGEIMNKEKDREDEMDVG
ncbi:histone acetyltransferases subunit 3-domain-containing protein [Amanita rubescens]|nr:histone acetyltransferases subunit 3-domain-containing protein [Amanita rubescens]